MYSMGLFTHTGYMLVAIIFALPTQGGLLPLLARIGAEKEKDIQYLDQFWPYEANSRVSVLIEKTRW